MSDIKIDRADWKAICDRLSTHIDTASKGKIEVAASGMSDQVEADWAPLLGVTYDERENTFEFAMDGVDHFIDSPKDLIVQGSMSHVKALVVTTNDMEGHRMKFKEPIDLSDLTAG